MVLSNIAYVHFPIMKDNELPILDKHRNSTTVLK
jgi:hypothetical protein